MVILIGMLGLIFGSFINALVWRLHERQKAKSKKAKVELSITRGRSMCPRCKHVLAPFDLIPVLSWVILSGRCRYCREPISLQYPVVELLTAGLFALSYLRLMPATGMAWLGFAVWLYILVSLIVLSVYDLLWMLLPDIVLLPMMGAAVVQLVIQLSAGAPFQTFIGPVVAAVLAGGGFYLLAAVSKGRWMGGGDIKLVFAMGLILGLRKLGVALFIGFDSAAIVGLALLALRLRKRSEQIPFGPFLVLGTLAAMLYGQALINWYLHISGLA